MDTLLFLSLVFSLISLGITAVTHLSVLSVCARARPQRRELVILAKDALMVGVWFIGGVKRSVNWRGTRLRIEKGSRLVPLERAQAAFERA